VSKDPWITFQPRDVDPVAGVIFYPAARAEPAAYAPILHALAARGFLVVMTPMPLNLAILAPERAGRVMARFSGIRYWIVAGHSLGGVAAATFAASHERELAGLMLWAATPGSFRDLSNSGIAVLSIFATGDALTTPADIERSRKRLPIATHFVPIEGGDHWSFGNFAIKRPPESISRESQKALILDAAQSFLEKLSAAPGSADDT
jgi:pimeloyl-ACP methyl ester carboxylesterase